MLKDEDGGAIVEAVGGMLLLVLLALGIVQVALVLYARNVMIASAHEGARAAVERGADPRDAGAVAAGVVRAATGRLVRDLRVRTKVARGRVSSTVTVSVTGIIHAPGPLPIPVRIAARGTASASELTP